MAGLRKEEREREGKGEKGRETGTGGKEIGWHQGMRREEPLGVEVRMEGPWNKRQERRTEQGAPRGLEGSLALWGILLLE